MRGELIPRPGLGGLATIIIFAVLVGAASPARAQSAREPLDVVAGEVLVVRGALPFALSDGPELVMPPLDDPRWGEREVPGLDTVPSPSQGWYRMHLRMEPGWPNDLAVALPPVYGSWSLWLNGVLVGVSAPRGATPAEERSRIVPLDSSLIRGGLNVLALQTRDWEGLLGVAGPIQIGPRVDLRAKKELGAGVSLGLALAFLLLGLFAAALGVSDRDRLTVLVALSLISLAAAGATLSDWWYLVFDDTESKVHLRHALFFLMHAGGLFLVEQLYVGTPERGTRVGALIAVALAGVSVVLPMGALFALHRGSWLLTCAAIGWVIYLGRGLPLRSPVVRAGVRAGFAGLLVAALFEVADGSWGLPGLGPFEYVFLALILAITGLFVILQARARGRAMSVLRSSRDGLAVLDLFGRLVHANPALSQMLGAPVTERAVLDERFDPRDAARLTELLSRLADQGRTRDAESMVVPMRGADGRELEIDLLAARLDDLHLLLSLRDVTERSRLEKEIARAQRLDSLGMLAGGIAHDFNNLLAGILIAASELEQDETAPEPLAQRAHSIAEAARRGGALTNRLLQFARGRVSPTVGVDLEGELPDMLDMLGRTLGRNLEWSIDVEADLPPVGLDEAELEQILVNLCVNARDAMAPGGGMISVRAWTEERNHERVVCLQIADDGPGMPPELLGRVIEPFVTTKGSGAGTGLGLAVVHGLVSGRGGEMVIDSQPGEGTKVTLSLPVRPLVHVPEPSPAPAPSPARDLRVLLVEDEQPIRVFLSRALERRGLSVEVLADGGAVLPWISAHQGGPPPVDAVVMDMMMPVIDGLEASHALREAWPGLPVVISSGYTGRESIEPLLETGPTLLLEKPYQVDDLIQALNQVVS